MERKSRGTIEPCPSFSIIVPTYQRRDLVCESLETLGALKYVGAIEIIVVVDGSTDGTAAALGQLNLPFPMRIIEQPNAGAGAARNRGAVVAEGDILLFLDDDMIAEPDLVEQHARMYRDGADAVIGEIELDSKSPAGFVAEGMAKWLRSCRIGNELTPFDIFAPRLSVRCRVFRQIGGFDESFTAGSAFAQEDADLGVKLLAGFDVRHNPLAISRLRYIVSPREQMQRSIRKAAGDVRFAVKHPALSKALWESNGLSRRVTRWVYRPLGRVPLLPKLLGEIATRAAEAGLRTRFRSNRVLARFFGTARAISYWAAIRSNGEVPDSDRLLILCYHSIADHSGDSLLAPFSVRPELFESQLDSLRRRGFTFVGGEALVAFLRGAPLPRRAVLLTFDDCYTELLSIARNVLRPRGIGAIAFPVTRMKSATNEWDQVHGAQPLRLLTTEELRELEVVGVKIGCHSRTHRDLTLLSDAERLDETAGAAADLVEAGLKRPLFFAYPYGFSNPAIRKVVRNAAYVAGFGLKHRKASRSSDPFDLPRVMILASDAGWRFRLKTRFPLTYAHLRQRFSRTRERM